MDSASSVEELGMQIIKAIQSINYQPIIPLIENVIRNSIEENFKQNGRYGVDNPTGGGSQAWTPSKRAIKQSGQTLQDTGQLAASIRVKVTQIGDHLEIEIGTNKKYAAIHQFGGTIQHPGGTPYIIAKNKATGKLGPVFISNKKAQSLASSKKNKVIQYTKAHTIHIPARPFLVLQDEDILQIKSIITRFLAQEFSK